MKTLQILKEEFLRVYSSKTADALFPPIIFVFIQSFYGLKTGLYAAIFIAGLLAIYRIVKGQKVIYALFAIVAVAFAGGYAYYTGNAKSFFLPKIINAGLGASVTLLSVLLRRPIAAYLSHLSRGWPIKWFWRSDVKPAYNEVTLMWALLFSLKLIVLFTLYNSGQVTNLLWINIILGTPATVVVLLLTYLYGSARLKRLKGPSIDEFLENKKPPYLGQNRGF